MPRSRSEAMLNLALAKQEDAQKLDDALFKSGRQSEERNRRSGWGRTLLGLVGAIGGTALAGPVGAAIGASLLGRIGSEAGEKLSSSPSKMKLEDYLFGKQDIRNINRNIDQQNRDFNQAQNVAMATDAISGYLASGALEKGIGLFDSLLSSQSAVAAASPSVGADISTRAMKKAHPILDIARGF